MARVKNELSNYQIIPRELIFDAGLSDRARFVYVFMSSKPDGWEFFLEPMADELHYSVDTLRKYINELIGSGWLVKGVQSNDKGRFGAVEYTIKASCKKPSTKKTDTEKFRHGKNPTQDNRYIIDNRDYVDNSNRENKKEKNIDKSISTKKEQFERWWALYDKKTGRAKCYAKWLRLSDEERELCIANTPAYVASTPNKQYRKHPLTYLNGECWNDEIVSNNTVGSLPFGMILDGNRNDIIERSKKDLW